MQNCLFDSVVILSDADECDTINGGCEQTCTNAIGSFVCSCGVGYLLGANGFNCTGKFTVTKYH